MTWLRYWRNRTYCALMRGYHMDEETTLAGLRVVRCRDCHRVEWVD